MSTLSLTALLTVLPLQGTPDRPTALHKGNANGRPTEQKPENQTGKSRDGKWKALHEHAVYWRCFRCKERPIVSDTEGQTTISARRTANAISHDVLCVCGHANMQPALNV